jgi:5-methylthioadenosine/S-adenosylhomocysteine deaminase
VPAREALALATCSGARAIHLDALIGSLEAGKRADITVVNLGRLHSAPRYTYSPDAIYSHLVYSAHSCDVRDTIVDGRFLLRDQQLCTLDAEGILAHAQGIADRINAFLAGREQNLLDKILAIGGVRQAEIFEVQVKAFAGDQGDAMVERLLNHADISITKPSERTQYDTYFLFSDHARGRIRIREDHRTDPGARADPKYTITLVAEDERGVYPSAILLSRARYTAPADRSLRFYREYFQPDRVVEIEKRRRRWRIAYQGEEFAINLDALVSQGQRGPYLEIKCRSWSRRDADERVRLIGELLAIAGVDEAQLLKQEYVEMT